ncbi:MAG: hypothetical protein HRT95_03675 [Moritella sp.]|uniref:hypothetical protein n=1 Tax=Moritella sp. TaxID=78556 RepID=UPI001D8947CF|nr:hypothetical protein [Moritella sp.]NQZ49304.1 hypothetical protein [Moritella sp.]
MNIQDLKNSRKEDIAHIFSLLPNTPIWLASLFLCIVIMLAYQSEPEFAEVMNVWMPYIIKGCSFVSLWFVVVTLLKKLYPCYDYNQESGGADRMAVSVKNKRPRDETNVRQAAVHEAGHTLSLALLSPASMPDIITVHIVKTLNDLKDTIGMLSFRFSSGEAPHDLSYTFWLMCCNRAGFISEKMVLGNEYASSTTDMHNWESNARVYCLLKKDLKYFALPSNTVEANVNLDTINILLNEIDTILMHFLKSNEELLSELVEDLIKHGELDKEQILTFVSRAVV